jgi:hypothetical protein
MKTLMVALVAFLFAFLIGCQENSITDPVTNETESYQSAFMENSVDKNLPISSYFPGAIKLDGLLHDPVHPLNSFAKINGVVRYKVDRYALDEQVKINLYIHAEIKSNCPTSDGLWTINETTEAIVDVPNNGSVTAYFEKSFRICHTCCYPMKLFVKFQVSKNVVNIVSMELVKGLKSEPIQAPSF